MRSDGREPDELRSIRIEAGVLERADGSARIEWGLKTKRILVPRSEEQHIRELMEQYYIKMHEVREKDLVVDVPEKLYKKLKELRDYEVVGEGFRGNIAVVAVYGPREPIPKHVGDPYKAIVRFAYRMAPFSVPERKRPAPGRREIEISKVCKEALQRVVFAEEFPMTAIDVFAELLSSDAGTRVTALTAAAVALADAGIPMRDMVTALAVGKIPVEGKETIVADLTKFEEDLEGAVDLPIAITPRNEEILLMQMDGRITKDQLEEAVELAIKKAKEIYEIQKNALKEKYRRVVQNE